MSYCRNNGIDSDVYVYADALFGGELLQCTCGENGKGLNREQMILHLIQHIRNGDKVPDKVFTRLIEEIKDDLEETLT